jgi:membrane-associated phospholipid phosphatase
MKHYTFVDYATQGYIALVGLLILVFHNERVPAWQVLLPAHVAALGLVHGLIAAHARRPTHPVLDFLRHFYPVLLYTAFYRETGMLNEMFTPSYLDPHLVQLEQRLFGFQPSLAFMDALPYLAVSELMYAAYFSYYVMIAGVGLALFLRDRTQFFHYVSVVSFVFYACYLMYIFVPVSGPRLFFHPVDNFQFPSEWLAWGAAHPIPDVVRHGPFYQIITAIYAIFEPAGAAMPSSHVAVALTTVWFSFRYLPRLRHFHAVVVGLLCLSTVYCRFHYAVDVVAGIAVAALLVPLANRLYVASRSANRAAPATACGRTAGTC